MFALSFPLANPRNPISRVQEFTDSGDLLNSDNVPGYIITARPLKNGKRVYYDNASKRFLLNETELVKSAQASLDVRPDSTEFVVQDYSSVLVFNEDGRLIADMDKTDGVSETTTVYTPDSKSLMIISDKIRVYDTKDYSLVRTHDVPNGFKFETIVFSPDSRSLITVHGSRTRVYDALTLEPTCDVCDRQTGDVFDGGHSPNYLVLRSQNEYLFFTSDFRLTGTAPSSGRFLAVSKTRNVFAELVKGSIVVKSIPLANEVLVIPTEPGMLTVEAVFVEHEDSELVLVNGQDL
jgi:WD40 repeat protein